MKAAFDEMPDVNGQHLSQHALKLPKVKVPEREGPKDAAEDNVTLPMSAQKLAGLRVELVSKAKALRCTQLVARIEHDRAAGFPGGDSEHVRKSRAVSSPGMDQHDRDLRRWERDYEKSLRRAIQSLETCRGIEQKVLVPVRDPSAAERRLAMGEVPENAVECETCHDYINPEDVRGAPRGLQECEACDRYRRRRGEARPRDLWGAA